jgi:hypothetical protein
MKNKLQNYQELVLGHPARNKQLGLAYVVPNSINSIMEYKYKRRE